MEAMIKEKNYSINYIFPLSIKLFFLYLKPLYLPKNNSEPKRGHYIRSNKKHNHIPNY